MTSQAVAQCERVFRLAADVTLQGDGPRPWGALSLARAEGVLPLDGLPQVVLERLQRLAAAPQPFEALVSGADSGAIAGAMREALAGLAGYGWVEELLLGDDGATLAAAHRPQVGLRPGSLTPGEPRRLRRHAFLRLDGGRWLLAHPGTGTVVETAAPLVLDFCREASASALCAEQLSPAKRALHMFLGDHGFLEPDADGATPQIGWEFHDALFHGVTTAGAASLRGYGATYPYRGAGQQAPPPRALRAPADAAGLIELPADLAGEREAEALGAVLAKRRSTRRFLPQPLPLAKLGPLLKLALQARAVTADGEDVAVFHPYASGGARGEMTTVLAVAACDGLDAGLYEYLERSHQLRRLGCVPSAPGAIIGLLAARTGGQGAPPPAALLFVADYKRMAWKYEAIAYATILRNVGCIYQVVGTAAAALGLGACAIGGGWGALAARDLAESLADQVIVGAVVLGLPGER